MKIARNGDTLMAHVSPAVRRIDAGTVQIRPQLGEANAISGWYESEAALYLEDRYWSLLEKFMPPSLPGFHFPLWTESPMPPKVATLLAVAGILCVLLSTMFGVTPVSNWFLYAAQVLLALGAIVLTVYILSGIIRDARAM
jgi:hypothetical protein